MHLDHTSYLILVLWAVLLLAAIPYTLHVRHPSTHPLAAYLVFVSVFTLCAAALFIVLTGLLSIWLRPGILSQPAGALAFLALVFIPAFFVGRWQLRQPRSRWGGRPPP
jgi:hypothetical protein